MANVLKREKQIQIVKMAVEGNSIRSIERITGVHRDTIMRLLVRVGNHCQTLHDEYVRGVDCDYCQCDEIWCYVGKKERAIRPGDPAEFGDTYTYVGMDQDTKLVAGFHVGKRSEVDTYAFMGDLSQRIDGHVQITTDGWPSYPGAVHASFNGRSSYAQVVKTYGSTLNETTRRYSPARLEKIRRVGMWGMPRVKYMSTSHVERQNLTIRMQMRRFTRLTNAFSKKLDNLKAAVAMHFVWYNFIRPHRSLGGITPAMAAGLASSRWTVDQLFPLPTATGLS